MSLTPQRQQQWQQIMHLGQQMVELAAVEEWQKIADIGADRQAKLQAFFQDPVSAEEAAEIAEGIQRLLESDRQLAETGLRARQKVMGAIHDMVSGRKAVAAYNDCPR